MMSDSEVSRVALMQRSYGDRYAMGGNADELIGQADAEVERWRMKVVELATETERLRGDFATLYAYLVRGEGKGPIRYVEALQMCSRNAKVEAPHG